jgi:hypothetical protein
LAEACKTLLASCPSCTRLHIDLFLHQQGLDTTTPGGKAIFRSAASRRLCSGRSVEGSDPIFVASRPNTRVSKIPRRSAADCGRVAKLPGWCASLPRLA